MELLLDQGLPRTAVGVLAQSRLRAVHVGEIGLTDATDAAILDHAQKRSQIVVSLDSDFHRLLALSGDLRPSVVRIRIEGLRARQLAALLLRVVEQFAEALDRGAVLSVTTASVRVRYLPIGAKPR